VLEVIANELSARVHVALMSQYYPSYKAAEFEHLKQSVDPKEYHKVIDKMAALGITRGFVQGMDSSENYKPDFEQDQPFD
jgi:uncharacterized Fe-S radical SAM superfamily protein PflX